MEIIDIVYSTPFQFQTNIGGIMSGQLRSVVNSRIVAAREAELPKHMVSVLKRYVEHGEIPGKFLRAVLENDFIGACNYADSINIKLLPQYASYLYHNMPSLCWGSKQIVVQWSSKKRDERNERNGKI
jgi:hypothetical protein